MKKMKETHLEFLHVQEADGMALTDLLLHLVAYAHDACTVGQEPDVVEHGGDQTDSQNGQLHSRSHTQTKIRQEQNGHKAPTTVVPF